MSSRPYTVEVPYLDPFAAFAPFADDSWAMFLDSAQACERQGRHSYIALDPWRTITAQGRQLSVDGALAIPVGGLDLFHQRDGGLMHREGGLAQTLAGRVKVVARHGIDFLLGCGSLAGAVRLGDGP